MFPFRPWKAIRTRFTPDWDSHRLLPRYSRCTMRVSPCDDGIAPGAGDAMASEVSSSVATAEPAKNLFTMRTHALTSR